MVAVLCLLVVVGAGMAYHIHWPWVGRHAYASSAFSTMARNHVTYGFGVTKLASIWHVRRAAPVESTLYVHHPTTYPIIVSLVFRLFGSTEAAARLVAITFSLGSVFALFWLVRHLWGSRAGFFAAAFFGLSPLNLYYGRVVSLEQPVVFFLILSTYLYVRWIQSDSRRIFVWLVLSMIGGILIEWQAQYLCVLLPLHYLMCVRRRGRAGHLVLLFLMGPLFFGLFLLHLMVLDWGQLHDLWLALMFRAGLMPAKDQIGWLGAAYTYTPLGLVSQLARNAEKLMRIPMLLLAATAAVSLGARLLRGRGERATLSVPLLLLAPGVVHTVLFHNAMYNHNYLIIFYLPGVATLAGVAVAEALAGWRAQRVRGWVTVILLVGFLVTSVRETASEHENASDEVVKVGRAIARVTQPLDRVLVLGVVFTPVVEWYADRDVYFFRSGTVGTSQPGGVDPVDKVFVPKQVRGWMRVAARENSSWMGMSFFLRRSLAMLDWLESRGTVSEETDEAIVYQAPSSLFTDPEVGPAFWEPVRRKTPW